jgi:transcriptional regulator GlxA family with amidase domain
MGLRKSLVSLCRFVYVVMELGFLFRAPCCLDWFIKFDVVLTTG